MAPALATGFVVGFPIPVGRNATGCASGGRMTGVGEVHSLRALAGFET